MRETSWHLQPTQSGQPCHRTSWHQRCSQALQYCGASHKGTCCCRGAHPASLAGQICVQEWHPNDSALTIARVTGRGSRSVRNKHTPKQNSCAWRCHTQRRPCYAVNDKVTAVRDIVRDSATDRSREVTTAQPATGNGRLVDAASSILIAQAGRSQRANITLIKAVEISEWCWGSVCSTKHHNFAIDVSSTMPATSRWRYAFHLNSCSHIRTFHNSLARGSFVTCAYLGANPLSCGVRGSHG